MMILPTPHKIFRVRGLGLCTKHGAYWRRFDQAKSMAGRNSVMSFVRRDTADVYTQVKLTQAWSNNHYTQRNFFNAMADVDRAFGHDGSRWEAWNPQHAS